MEQLKEDIINLLVTKYGYESIKYLIEVQSEDEFATIAFPYLGKDDEIHAFSIIIYQDRSTSIVVDAKCKIKDHYKALKFVNDLNINHIGMSFMFIKGVICASLLNTCVDRTAKEVLDEAMYVLDIVSTATTMRN